MSQTPLVIENPREMRAHATSLRDQGLRIGFVPTMGALHQGHLSLLDHAGSRCDRLVVSIFLNPLQFNQQSDLDRYPRTFESDREKCAAHGAHVIYAPNPQVMYPEGFQTTVSVAKVSQGLCGAHRLGHFDGVTTVVLKLFNAVQPHLAAFGEKDYQQLQVIKRMTLDLDLGVEVVGCPTVRETDGLAMSSRNVYLNKKERENALCLWRALNRAHGLAQTGEDRVEALKTAARAEIEAVEGARLEYLEVVDPTSLEGLERLDRPARMALAVWLGGTRLIDNMAL